MIVKSYKLNKVELPCSKTKPQFLTKSSKLFSFCKKYRLPFGTHQTRACDSITNVCERRKTSSQLIASFHSHPREFEQRGLSETFDFFFCIAFWFFLYNRYPWWTSPTQPDLTRPDPAMSLFHGLTLRKIMRKLDFFHNRVADFRFIASSFDLIFSIYEFIEFLVNRTFTIFFINFSIQLENRLILFKFGCFTWKNLTRPIRNTVGFWKSG